MPTRFQKAVAIALLAVWLSLPTYAVHATSLLTNRSFESDTNAANRACFPSFHPTWWSGRTGLALADAAGSADGATDLTVYGAFLATGADGGNFVEGCDDLDCSAASQQTTIGLAAGPSYTLTFFQPTGQPLGFAGQKTEQWEVTFGDGPATDIRDLALYALPRADIGPGKLQTMTFAPGATANVVGFLAYGTSNSAPTIAPRDSVDLEIVAPEPASLSVMGIGVLAIAVIARRRRVRRPDRL